MNNANLQLANLSRELTELIKTTCQAADHLNSGLAADVDKERVIAWTASAGHQFRRQAAAIARIRMALVRAANLPT